MEVTTARFNQFTENVLIFLLRDSRIHVVVALDRAPEVRHQKALARVVLRRLPMLILDEATAEAGSFVTGTLEKAANKVTEAMTALVGAHRLECAMTADRILVMDQGALVEDGDHDELMAQQGRYA